MSNKVAITTTSFAEYDNEPIVILKNNGYAVAMNPYARKLKSEEVIALCSGCSGIIAGTEKYDRETLKKLSDLKAISRVGVGIDNVDLVAAKDLNIKVLNTPEGPTLAVAELTIGLILNLLRKISLMDKKVRLGTWKKYMGNLLAGKKIGIIGFGRIGQKVAAMLLPFGVEIAYFDVNPGTVNPSYRFMKKVELLNWADIVSLHCGGVPKGEVVLGEKEFDVMKDRSWIINTARGEIVDEESLCNALISGKLAGAAIDTFNNEPYSGKLIGFENVILTPHIGSYAKESRINMELEAVNNLIVSLNSR